VLGQMNVQTALVVLQEYVNLLIKYVIMNTLQEFVTQVLHIVDQVQQNIHVNQVHILVEKMLQELLHPNLLVKLLV